MNIFLYWGKTDPGGTSRYPCKPVLHHLIDVTAVASVLQLRNPKRLRREAALIGVDADRLARASAFLAGLHDLGKLSISFQAKVRELWPAEILGEHPGDVYDRGHWRNTAIILRWRDAEGVLQGLFPNLRDGLEVIAGSIAGHHGAPPARQEYAYNRNGFCLELQVTRPCLEAAVESMRILHGLVAPKPLPEITEPEQAWRMSWRLAGLTTLADWVGSDAQFFAFEDPAMPSNNYWRVAQERASEALEAKGLLPSSIRAGIGFAMLAPQVAPRPMQACADTIALGDGPQLFVIEDTTGSGKTEAALALAGRLMAAGKAEGIYFALPTMATANAMFARLGDIRQSLFSDDSTPSLVLAHGRAELVHDMLANSGLAGNGGGEDNAAWCAAWIADNRRKAFFADIGAGTIDQAFLAVLKKKHLALRQYGLGGRVLIVDEAHAFDAYMGRELETLLGVHAAHGGSAIVLSATLPAARRAAIVASFRKGLGGEETAWVASSHYPMLTVAGGDGAAGHDVSFCGDLRRRIGVERLCDRTAAHVRVLEAARRGAAVLVICNAVDEAIASFEALRAEHAETGLFHARFAMCDRLSIEAEALARFGRDAKPEDRAGHILVATQVVEQSLDLDFDLVISDLAPIDLLIQRAGRLWRHMDRRPDRAVDGPTLCVISPKAGEATHENWLIEALGAGAFVYRHPGVMWRTAKVLFEAGAIHVPEDLRPFIERAYGSDDVPACLARGQDEAEGRAHGERFQAGTNLIDFAAGYVAMGAPANDQEIGSRLGEETLTLRLARMDGGKLLPWADRPVDGMQPKIEYSKRDTQGNWALSEVSVRASWLGNAREPRELEATIRAAKATWPEWERDAIRIAVVEANGQIRLVSDRQALRYLPATGLTARLLGE